MARQSGVLSRDQLLRLGVAPHVIQYRVKTARLLPLYRGVYAFGHRALPDRGRAIAALLAAGPHAIASHHTAAALWGFTGSMPAVQDVTLLKGDRRRRDGLNVHHATDPPEVRHRDRIPVTSPKRTLEDRARDADLAAAGCTVLRFTWRQIAREPLRVVARIAQAAAARAPSASYSSV